MIFACSSKDSFPTTFTGSIGGGATSALYQDALRRLKEVLTPLPDSTILLPGHGPATTLGEERTGNPFL